MGLKNNSKEGTISKIQVTIFLLVAILALLFYFMFYQKNKDKELLTIQQQEQDYKKSKLSDCLDDVDEWVQNQRDLGKDIKSDEMFNTLLEYLVTEKQNKIDNCYKEWN